MKKWDTDKKETMDKFYSHYPQFTKYPKIFDGQHTDTINGKSYKPEYFKPKSQFNIVKNTFLMALIILLLVGLGVFKNLKHFT